MSDNNTLRPLVRQIVTRDSQQQRLERRALCAADVVLFLLLLAQAPPTLLVWLIGVIAHCFAAYPAILKRKPQSAVARQHADVLKARRALERMGLGASNLDRKTKNDGEHRLLDDGELAVPWYPDGEELRLSVRRLIHMDRPAQRERLKRARLIHIVLFCAHILVFVGANALLTPKLDAISVLGWSAGLLLHGYTVYLIEPTPEDDEKRIRFVLENLHQLDPLHKRKKNEPLQLSSDGEIMQAKRAGEK
jgi:hypothetical protein